jgi:transcriptional regulator with XRE-family HTH domain
MPQDSYDDVLAANIRAARSRRGLQQEPLAARMRALGYSAWLRQTVANVEKGRRRVTAGEIFGLAVALEVTIPQLMAPSDPDGLVEFPNGQVIHSFSVEQLAGRGRNDHAVQWADDGMPVFFQYVDRPARDPFDDPRRPMMTAQGRPEAQQPAMTEPHDDHGTGPEPPDAAS